MMKILKITLYQRLVYKKNDPNMKILAWESTPDFKKFINYFSDWRSKGYLDNTNVIDILNTDDTYNDMVNKLLSGKMSSCISDLQTVEDLNVKLKTTNHSNWKFKGYLLYPDKKVQRDSPIDGAIALSANSPNVKRALMFLNWIQSNQDNYDLFMYGILGENYTLEGKNLKLPEGQSSSKYIGWGGHDAFKSTEFERIPDYLKGTGERSYMDLFKNHSEYTPDLGFSMSYSNVETEAKMRLIQYSSDIDLPFMNGTLDKNAMEQALVDLKAVDTDKIINDLQTQLNSWRKKNK